MSLLKYDKESGYTEFHFIEAFCALRYKNECVLLIFIFHLNSTALNELLGKFDLEKPSGPFLLSTDWLLYKISEELVGPILSYTSNDIWGIGSVSFLWNKEELVRCRD